jgi:hypothetical protein
MLNQARDSRRLPRSCRTIAVIPAICPAVRHSRARTGAGCGTVSSEHLAAPGQKRLFESRRDWRPVAELERQDLPTLTE